MTASDTGETKDRRPDHCRFRLQDEGKPYPKSSCQACGKGIASGLGRECSITAGSVDDLRRKLQAAEAQIISLTKRAIDAESERDEARRSWQEAADALTMESNRIDALLPRTIAAEAQVAALTKQAALAESALAEMTDKRDHERFAGLMTGPDPAAVWKQQAVHLAHALDAAEARIAALTELPEPEAAPAKGWGFSFKWTESIGHTSTISCGGLSSREEAQRVLRETLTAYGWKPPRLWQFWRWRDDKVTFSVTNGKRAS